MLLMMRCLAALRGLRESVAYESTAADCALVASDRPPIVSYADANVGIGVEAIEDGIFAALIRIDSCLLAPRRQPFPSRNGTPLRGSNYRASLAQKFHPGDSLSSWDRYCDGFNSLNSGKINCFFARGSYLAQSGYIPQGGEVFDF